MKYFLFYASSFLHSTKFIKNKKNADNLIRRIFNLKIYILSF